MKKVAYRFFKDTSLSYLFIIKFLFDTERRRDEKFFTTKKL
jgi:hypothetical protein